jgi:tetratricopeptide (TPR) repeat protein
MLEKDPKLRYQSASDLHVDLERLRRDWGHARSLATVRPTTSSVADAPSVGEAASDSGSSDTQIAVGLLRRHKLGAAGALLAVGAAAGLAIWFGGTLGPPALEQEDQLIVTDFVNTTGDEDFDGALKAALIVKLEESPYLNVVPETSVQETLGLMERPPDTRITPTLGREICQRQGVKAMMQGEIASLGSRYLVTLNAENCQTGESLARQQAQADTKEDVLDALDSAATRMRRSLGESLASIEASDTPLSRATTPSLEALRAYDSAQRSNLLQKYEEAISFGLRAIELDPNFASAHLSVSTNYGNLGETEAARKHAQSAFELRERASERERFDIVENYYWSVTMDIDKAIETLEMAVQSYPREGYWNNLAIDYRTVGRHEEALKACLESIRLERTALYLNNAATTYSILGKGPEGKALLEKAIAEGVETVNIHRTLYRIAFLEGDLDDMAEHAAWVEQHPGAIGMLRIRRQEAARLGKLGESRKIFEELVDTLRREGRTTAAAGELLYQAGIEATLGKRDSVSTYVRRAEDLGVAFDSRVDIALALAAAGEVAETEQVMAELEEEFPDATLLSGLHLPTARAMLALKQGELEAALEVLRPTRIRSYPGLEPFSILHPLSGLGLARAKALSGNETAARRHYQDFLALWKEADLDIPIFQEAKAEYERLSE